MALVFGSHYLALHQAHSKLNIKWVIGNHMNVKQSAWLNTIYLYFEHCAARKYRVTTIYGQEIISRIWEKDLNNIWYFITAYH